MARARIIKAGIVSATAVTAPASSAPRQQIIRREVLHAEELAQEILGTAHEKAKQVLSEAVQTASELATNAELEGFEQGRASAVKAALAFASLEAQADQRAADRSLQIARILAERLIGKALELDPATVVSLAEQALAEVRGAHRIVLMCNPGDAAALAELQGNGSVSGSSVDLQPTADQQRGHVSITTNVGNVDASIGSRLDVLIEVLKDSANGG